MNQLSRAILLYEGFGMPAATLHPVELQEGRAWVKPGSALNLEAAQAILRSLVNETCEWIPTEVVAMSCEKVVWWKPAHRGEMIVSYMHMAQRHAVQHPPLLFRADSRGSLFVWALRENQRPSPGTPLHHAPYWNVYETGEVCQGESARPGTPGIADINRLEAAFFGSTFTHSLNPNLLRGVDYFQFWKARRGKKPSLRGLNPAGRTVGEVI